MLLLHAKEGANTFALLEGPHREHKVEVGHSTFFISHGHGTSAMVL